MTESGKNSCEAILDDVFSNAIADNEIIKNPEPLLETFVPKVFLHRDDQIRAIAEVVSPVLKERQPSNVFIIGRTGTGKTAITRWILKRLVEKAKQNSVQPPQVCYVNYRIAGGTYRTIVELCKQLGIDKTTKIPATGLSHGEIFERFREGLDSQKKTVIIIIDEVDQYIEEEATKVQGDSLLYNLNRMELSQSKIVIFGIANRESKEWLDAGTLSTLKAVEIYFPPYNAIEIGDILRQRAELAFLKETTIDKGTINYFAARAAAEHGDARRVVNILRVAAELAIARKSECITEKHIRDAEISIDFNNIIDDLKKLSAHNKALIISVFTKGDLTADNERQHTTVRIYETYLKLCQKMNLHLVEKRRASQLLNELAAAGFIVAKIKNGGRYGRTNIFTLKISPEIIDSAFEDHEVYGPIIKSYLSFYIT